MGGKPLLCLAGLLWATVCQLLAKRGPADVSGSIVPIVVDPVDTVLLTWPQADGSKEINKGVSPARADLDAATAIVLPACGLRVRATLDHRSPNGMFRRLGSLSAMTMFDFPRVAKLSGQFGVQATATPTFSSPERSAVHAPDSSALTTAAPIHRLPTLLGLTKNPPSSETSAGDVFEGGLSGCRLAFNHRTSNQDSVARADEPHQRLVGPIILPSRLGGRR